MSGISCVHVLVLADSFICKPVLPLKLKISLDWNNVLVVVHGYDFMYRSACILVLQL